MKTGTPGRREPARSGKRSRRRVFPYVAAVLLVVSHGACASEGTGQVQQHAAAFGPRIEWLRNKFAWYGTRQRFDCLGQLVLGC